MWASEGKDRGSYGLCSSFRTLGSYRLWEQRWKTTLSSKNGPGSAKCWLSKGFRAFTAKVFWTSFTKQHMGNNIIRSTTAGIILFHQKGCVWILSRRSYLSAETRHIANPSHCKTIGTINAFLLFVTVREATKSTCELANVEFVSLGEEVQMASAHRALSACCFRMVYTYCQGLKSRRRGRLVTV